MSFSPGQKVKVIVGQHWDLPPSIAEGEELIVSSVNEEFKTVSFVGKQGGFDWSRVEPV